MSATFNALHAAPDAADGLRDGRGSTTSWSLSGRAQPESPLMEVGISTPQFTIGRRVENSLCLPNTTVSGRHAELTCREQRLFLADLGSTNGTLLNGRRISAPEVVHHNDQLQFGTARFVVRQHQGSLSGVTVAANVSHYALPYLQFDKLMTDRAAVIPHFQPIVELSGKQCVGYEVLARSTLAGLETPGQMFRVAKELNCAIELSRMLRREGLRHGVAFGPQMPLYLNTFPSELGKPELLESLQSLRQEFPALAIVLEIHEAAVTSSNMLVTLRRELQELQIGLAYDDFGAGQARLLELADAPPDVIKFDIHLITGLHEASVERVQMVSSLVQMVRSVGSIPLAEGVEAAADAAACRDLGFTLAQGYFFGRPAPAQAWLPGGAVHGIDSIAAPSNQVTAP